MTLTLYSHPLSSYCWKVLIALYENGTPFDARMVNLGDPEAKAAFKTLWPTAKIPLLQDGNEVIPETSIMIEHIEQRYPGKVRLIPQDPREQLNVRLWDRLFDLYVMAPMQRFIAQQLRPAAERDMGITANSLTELQNAYDMIEARRGNLQLGGGGKLQHGGLRCGPGVVLCAHRCAIFVQPREPGPLLRPADGTPIGQTGNHGSAALFPLLPAPPFHTGALPFGCTRDCLTRTRTSWIGWIGSSPRSPMETVSRDWRPGFRNARRGGIANTAGWKDTLMETPHDTPLDFL